MNLKNKKGSESLVSTKLIVLILVVLVVITILVFAFRSDTLNWLKNLPGFKESPDREIDMTTLSPEELANIGYTCEASDDNKSMIIKSTSYGNAIVQEFTADYREVYFFSGDQKSLVKSNLLMKMNSGSPDSLVISRFSNLTVGKVSQRIFRVEDNSYKAFMEKDSFYGTEDAKTLREGVGKKEYLDRIDQSYVIGGSLFCKKNQIPNKVLNSKQYEFQLTEGYFYLYKDGQMTHFGLNPKKDKIFYSIGGTTLGTYNEILNVNPLSGELTYTSKGNDMQQEIRKYPEDAAILDYLIASKINNLASAPYLQLISSKENLIAKIVQAKRAPSFWSTYGTFVSENYLDRVITDASGLVSTSITWLYIKGDSVYLYNRRWSDVKVGSIVQNVLSINADLLKDYTTYKKKYSLLPEKEVLELLNSGKVNLDKMVVYK